MKTLTTEEKKSIIQEIMSHLRFHASENGKHFDAGDIFFSLCFKSDDELLNIAKLSGAI